MPTIFDFLGDILFYKKGDLLDNIDDEVQYNPYMINRWISMYSPNCAKIINGTTNRFYPIFETKQENYRFLIQMIPSQHVRRIHYIKKVDKNVEENKVNGFIANTLQISKREIKYYIETHNLSFEQLEKALK